MKKLFLITFLSIFSLTFAQKKKCMEKEITFSEREYIFYSEFNGGESEEGYSILKNQEELDRFLGDNGNLADEEKIINKIKFPKNQKLIIYHLGEFRSGDHQPRGIEKIKINGNTMEVFLKSEKKENKSSDFWDSEPQIMVVSRPWMILSVPKNFNFNNIVIKYE